MSVCDRIEARSMALAALPASDPERTAAEGHACSCARCARALRDGAQLVAMVSAELRPAPALEVFARAEQAVLHEWDREFLRPARRSRLLAAAGSAVIFVVLCATARHLVRDLGSWATAGAAASLAALLSALAPAGRRILPIVFASSLGLALIAASGTGVASGDSGLTCLGLELICALIPFALCAMTGARLPESAEARAALAGAAALAAQAALHLSCPIRGALVHLITFHFAGVVIAAAVGARLQIRRVR